ncbi:MAG: Asp-tRNA(Asn)/Glu-tRNA(Gln) amidotransferase subunit GatA [Balneola sp.]|nr:Asp-tRNA(Asn)/Glu-tRNA(Gln) amidotransferase subunit GatA [Balneola sp.]MBO6652180.1 Asp-tRNA(Asn)/Glu-tRNA(Gln) amidotransferase subunit GatA [Balneola sp.]MBO6710693.1 Asp-tRNA(Asn)/Glu-tRNA(Gln) amidotransferase subunit GatA [Balneola sp.]MBO6799379.1 Asp-tRNA(Asn)/Glu-tRNA(Gln) amidotransferase subunit GatA [Balneola sp.]MBO6869492.1 Asp-tRNA(Asn)/Glu-tRNA(Gln) amidotransferase subunit GatA [Balneola sp.]
MSTNSIAEIKEQILNENLSLKDIVTDYIARIEEQNSEINAFVSTYFEEALSEAEKIEKKIKNGTAGSLAGAVLGIKDLICERGRQATCASEILGDFESVYDATVIERLKAEDAILIGRTNMDEFAMGSANQFSRYGAVKNPVDTSKVSGGSSGGSAAAVASKMVSASLGSDTGGSIRQPAAFCGVVGVKPTYGRVSRWGLIAFASSFDCIGPFANNVEDAARVLQAISGFDEKDNTSANIPVQNFTEELKQPNKNIRIGVPEEYFGEGLDSEISSNINETLKKLESEGAELVPISLPHTKYGIATYYVLATAEASSNLARFDGIRYGHRAEKASVVEELKEEESRLREEFKDDQAQLDLELSKMDSALIKLYKKSRTEGFGTEVKRRIMLGTYVLSSGYYDAYYAKAQKVRRLIQEDFKKAFEKVDVIAGPTTPTTAFEQGAKLDDPVQMYLNDIYTTSANLAGICGISVPSGSHSNGLPIGIQFLADSFQESKILNAGRLVELLDK